MKKNIENPWTKTPIHHFPPSKSRCFFGWSLSNHFIIFPWISPSFSYGFQQNLSYPGDANLGRILPELREEIRGLPWCSESPWEKYEIRWENDGKMMKWLDFFPLFPSSFPLEGLESLWHYHGHTVHGNILTESQEHDIKVVKTSNRYGKL